MVQFNNQTEEDAVWGMIDGRSIPALKFSQELPPGSGNHVPAPIGTSYEGVLAESPKKHQVTDYNTKLPKFFKDGVTPIEELIFTLNTNYRDPGNTDDDGQRRIYMGQSMKRALQDEVKRLGIKRFGVGTAIRVTLTGFKPNPGGQPSKIYQIDLRPTEYVPPAEDVSQFGLGSPGYAQQNGQQGWQQPQQAAPQQQYQAAAAPTFPGQMVPQQQQFQQQAAAPPAWPQQDPQQQGIDFAALAAQQAAQQAPAQIQQGAQFGPGSVLAPQQPPAQIQQAPLPQQAPPPQQFQQLAQQQFPPQPQVYQVPTQAPQAPQAPQVQQAQPTGVTQEHLDQVALLIKSSFTRDLAVSAVADSVAPGDQAFREALDGNIPF